MTRPSPCMILSLLGLLIANARPARAADDRPPEPSTSAANAALMASIDPLDSQPDVVLPEGTDLVAYVRDSLGLAPDAYVAPLIISAADANGDSQTSDYFFSFGSGLYNLTDGCHMAPVYLPHGGAVTVTVNNFFVFALDNNAGADVTYSLWRKNTLNTDAPQLMGTVATTGASTAIQIVGDTTIDNAVVTQDYAYHITWCYTGANEAVLGFWIFYSES